jgi:hypothetical protein
LLRPGDKQRDDDALHRDAVGGVGRHTPLEQVAASPGDQADVPILTGDRDHQGGLGDVHRWYACPGERRDEAAVFDAGRAGRDRDGDRSDAHRACDNDPQPRQHESALLAGNVRPCPASFMKISMKLLRAPRT